MRIGWDSPVAISKPSTGPETQLRGQSETKHSETLSGSPVFRQDNGDKQDTQYTEYTVCILYSDRQEAGVQGYLQRKFYILYFCCNSNHIFRSVAETQLEDPFIELEDTWVSRSNRLQSFAGMPQELCRWQDSDVEAIQEYTGVYRSLADNTELAAK